MLIRDDPLVDFVVVPGDRGPIGIDHIEDRSGIPTGGVGARPIAGESSGSHVVGSQSQHTTEGLILVAELLVRDQPLGKIPMSGDVAPVLAVDVHDRSRWMVVDVGRQRR